MKQSWRVWIAASSGFLILAGSWLWFSRPAAHTTSGGAGVWGPSSYWFPLAEGGNQPLPGIDQGTLAMGIWFHDGGHVSDPAFVVWVGEHGGGQLAYRTDSLAQKTGKSGKFEGLLAGVPVECNTTDGKTGTVKIGVETYELVQGSLFLVSTRPTKPKVKQLRLAKLNLKPEGSLSPDQMTHEYLRGLAKADPEIVEFFTTLDQPK